MKVLEYIQSESDRQSATLDETINMVEAWRYVRDFSKFPNLATIIHIAAILNGTKGYRQMPAVFDQGRTASRPSLIAHCMDAWWSYTDAHFANNPTMIDSFMQEFLAIHPFADGNGRVASLLYNHMRGTMDDPVALPYYFGEN